MPRKDMPPRRPPPPREPPGPAGSPPLGKQIHDSILADVRRRIARSPGGHLVNGRLGSLELRLEVSLRDAAAGAERLAAELDRAVQRFVDEAVEAAASFRPGRAFCHRCESAGCAHAAPPGPRDAFAGYSPTGVPRWTDFGQLCLDLRHPEIDRLYDETGPAILVQPVDGPALKADLLPEFHRSARRHDVAGQVCAGLFPIPGLPDGERGVALTFQAVVTERSRGGRRVGLNVLGGGRGGEEALGAAPPECKPWRGALLWAQARLAEVSRGAGAARTADASFDRRVAGVLRGMARRIEADLRGRGRRTRHAEERHRSGERPTRKAIDDLRAAATDAVLVDARHATLAVLGERGRVHFFAPEGRLVSSVHYTKDEIAKRMRLGWWRPATQAEVDALRARVEGTTPPG